jgi:hypothetical protein
MDQIKKYLKTQGVSAPESKAPAGAPRRAVNPARDLVATPINEGDFLSRSREAAIGVLEPFTLPAVGESLVSGAETIGSGLWDAFTGEGGKEMPLSGASLGKMRDFVNAAVKVPLQKIPDYWDAVKRGDYDRASYLAGGILSQTVPALEAPYSAAKFALEPTTPGTYKGMAQKFMKKATGQSAEDVFRPKFKKYAKEYADAGETNKAAQVKYESDVKAAEEAAKKTNAEKLAEHKANTKASQYEAIRSNEAAQREYQAKVGEAESEASRQTAENEAAFEHQQQFNIDSQRLGEQTVKLNDALKTEADELYEPVHKATANDPGLPLKDAADAAKKKLAGSPESIRQFNEAVKIEETTKEPKLFNFRDTQGFRQEIDRVLERGDLLGDVYQALTEFRRSLTDHMEFMAKQAGVTAELARANEFYRDWKQLFGRKSGPLGEVLDRAESGVTQERTTPEFYQEAFTTGKGAKTAGIVTDMLRKLKTKNSAAANALADLADQLRTRYNRGERPAEFGAQRPATVMPKDVKPPKPVGTEQTPPPKEVQPKEVKSPETIVPKEPNVGEIVEQSKGAIGERGRGFQEVGPFDVRRMGYGAVGGGLLGAIRGHPLETVVGAVIGAIIPEAAKFSYGRWLESPKLQAWIAAPDAASLAEAERLPEPVQSRVKAELQSAIDKAREAGQDVRVHPQVERWLARQSRLFSGTINNRQDGYDRAINPNK